MVENSCHETRSRNARARVCGRPMWARAGARGAPARNGCLESLLAEDLERVLERRDLLLAPGRALGVVNARVQAGRLELVEVLERRVELLLRALEIAHGLRKVRLRGDLLLALRLELLRLGVLVRLGGGRELFEGGLRRGLLRARLLVEADEVREDHLEHAGDAAAGHARVGLVEGLRRIVLRLARLRLRERSRARRLGVEALEHAERRLHGLLRLLGVLDGRGVLVRLLLADRG